MIRILSFIKHKILCKLGLHEVVMPTAIVRSHKMLGIPLKGQCVHCGKYGYMGIKNL